MGAATLSAATAEMVPSRGARRTRARARARAARARAGGVRRARALRALRPGGEGGPASSACVPGADRVSAGGQALKQSPDIQQTARGWSKEGDWGVQQESESHG